jgi:hypothetical protein
MGESLYVARNVMGKAEFPKAALNVMAMARRIASHVMVPAWNESCMKFLIRLYIV